MPVSPSSKTCFRRSTVQWICVLVTSCVLSGSLLHGPAYAQPGGGRGGFPGFGGPGMNMGGLELLFSQQVKDEIELVGEQEDQIRELSDSMRGEMRSAFQDMQGMSDEERQDFMQKRMSEVREKVQTQLKDILLDHQLERLKQLQLQSTMQRGNAADALASDDIRQTLGITDAQLEQMRAKATEAEEELRRKIQEAAVEARAKVLSVLTAEQRAKWEQMVGPSFEFQQGGFFGRGGGPGGGFGPGGGGPGGGGGRGRRIGGN